MSLRVKIDHREGRIKEFINTTSLPCPVEFENLEHGDIVVIYEDNPIFVFERKTIADLKASIHDGRYRNQKLNMLQTYDHSQVYYIIEGELHMHDKALTGAVINTMLRDKIGIFKTRDVNDTLQLLYDVVQRVNEDPHKYMSPEKPQRQPSVHNHKESVFVNMLCQIPHISMKTAIAINDKYKSFQGMHRLFEHKTNDERLNSLHSIMTVDRHGKGRKISSAACVQLVRAYYGEHETL